jgi:hypothetical protein
MKRVLLIYLVLIIGIIGWYLTAGTAKKVFNDAQSNALKVSKHSRQFNASIEEVIKNYYKLTNDFVKEDTGSINKTATQLQTALENFKVDELKKDTGIYETAAGIWDNTKTEITGMASDPSLQSKRESLNLFSNELFTLILTIRYDVAKLFWQECSSAFGDDTPGNWLSESEQSKNPYGKKDCTTLKMVIDFVPPDTSKH